MEILEKHILDAKSAFHERNWKLAIKLWEKIIANYPETHSLIGPARLHIIGDAKLHLSVSKRIIDLKKTKKEISDYRKQIHKKSALASFPRVAIYTVVTGSYDSLKLPEKIDPRFEYIAFSDRPISGGGIWQIKPVLSYYEDQARTSRVIKLHPYQLLKDFDIAVYVDSNLMLLEDISGLIEKFLKSKKPLGTIKHPYRKSVYEEIEACIALKKDNTEVMRQQINGYRNEGFQDHNLVEANLLIFDIKNRKALDFLNHWWREMENGSRRDQLSFNYALKKVGTTYCSLMDNGYTTRNSPLLAWVHHDFGKGPAQTLINELNFPIHDPFSGHSYSKYKKTRLKTLNSTSIEVVLYIGNHSKRFRECLKSIESARIHSAYNLVVLNNSSGADVKNYLESFRKNKSWIQIVHTNTSKPLPYTEALNKGLRKTAAEFVILLESDALVSESWAEKLADSVLSTHGAGLASPMTNAPYYSNAAGPVENTPIVNVEALDIKYEHSSPIDILPQVHVLNSFCLGISRKTINEIGYFDSANFPDGHCHVIDYCFRAADKGFLSIVATHTYVTQLDNGVKDTPKSMNQSLLKLQKIYPPLRIDRATKATIHHPLVRQLRDFVESRIDVDPLFSQVKNI